MRTTKTAIAKAARIRPTTRTITIRDAHGMDLARGMNTTTSTLALVARTDLTPTLDARIHLVAYAIYKSLTTGRMNPQTAARLSSYTPYAVCGLIADVAERCPAQTIGAICDEWLPANHASL